MVLGIRSKLAIAFATTSLLITMAAFAAMWWSFRAGFLQYVNDLQLASLQAVNRALVLEVADSNQWQLFVHDRRRWDELVRQAARATENPLLPQRPPRPGSAGDHDKPRPLEQEFRKPFGRDGAVRQRFNDYREFSSRPRRQRRPPSGPFVLLDKDQRIIHGPRRVVTADNLILQPVEIQGEVLGYIGIKRLRDFSSEADKVFVARQTQLFVWIAVASSVLSVLLAFVLAKYMVVPVKLLGEAMTALAGRRYKTRVNYQSRDELGRLVQSFNQLAQTLEGYASSQQQWIADISHELRTPLATLRGEIEAIQDGVRDLSPARLQSLAEEVLRLQGLVDDLHQLALSDLGAMRYRFSDVALSELLEDLFERYDDALKQQQIQIGLQLEGRVAAVYGDDDRLYQLFRNLIQNSLRYTDCGGRILVSVRFGEDIAEVLWQDSPPSVPEAHMSKLFDRLYRTEQSRDRSQGGSGLGLSICKSIVQAHNGRISAEPSSLGGLAIRLCLPLSQSTG